MGVTEKWLRDEIIHLSNDLDACVDEIVRLQARVEALERHEQVPDNAFWGQLMFDVATFIAAIVIIIRLFA